MTTSGTLTRRERFLKRGKPRLGEWQEPQRPSQLDDSIRKSKKFSISPLVRDVIVVILSFIFNANLPFMEDSRLEEIEERFVKMLLNFRDGYDWTNYEKNILGPCEISLRPVAITRPVAILPKQLPQEYLGDLVEVESDDERMLRSIRLTPLEIVRRKFSSGVREVKHLLDAIHNMDDF